MKKRNNTMKQMVATSAIALMGFVANGQLLETMGTVGSGTQTIAARESAGNFALVALTYTGSADMRTTTPSTGYTGASGGYNTLIQAQEDFEMQGVNAATCTTSDSIRFGVFKSTNASTGIDYLVLEYSNDNGASWSSMSFPALPTGTGTSKWYKRSAAMPAGALVANLRIRFRSTLVGTSSSNPQFRVDDISTTCGSTVSCGEQTATIAVTGSTILCAGSTLPQFTVTTDIDNPFYQWFNQDGTIAGADSDVLTATGSGTYYVTVSSEDGCEATSVKEYVLVYPAAQFCQPRSIQGCPEDVTQVCVNVKSSDLIFSQYVEGTGFNKYLEIFNGTCADVDLSGYELRAYHNGASFAGLPTYTIALSGTLVAGDVFVVAHDSATVWTGIPDLYSKFLQFNGNDALVLYKLGTSSAVDIFGSVGNDPGSAWRDSVALSPTYLWSTENKTLVRKACVYSGITVNPDLAGIYGFPTLFTEWDTLTTNDVTGLGVHAIGASAYNFSVTTGDATVASTTGNCANIEIGTVNSVVTVTGTFCGFNSCGGSTTFAANVNVDGCGEGRSALTTSGNSQVELFPNPTTGLATVTFTTNSDEQVSVVVFDLSGKERMTLANEFVAKGTHRLQADLSKLAAGTYLIRIASATENQTLRVIKTDK
ncbi:T9SS type A sorting domain-containing protein [Fluviicola sp.]|uniref:T9SS type A sorting domain-containing protein n=1 Tax=Fluviicola sp. TaxID=1917219 RepID=UPI003D2D00F3